MKRIYLALACFVLILSVGAPLHAGEPGFVSLFDGTTLNGWMEGPQIDINPPNPELTGKLWNEGRGPHRWLSSEPPLPVVVLRFEPPLNGDSQGR